MIGGAYFAAIIRRNFPQKKLKVATLYKLLIKVEPKRLTLIS